MVATPTEQRVWQRYSRRERWTRFVLLLLVVGGGGGSGLRVVEARGGLIGQKLLLLHHRLEYLLRGRIFFFLRNKNPAARQSQYERIQQRRRTI